MLAMHMANELLTPGVALGLMVVAGACVAVASARTRGAFDESKVPLMGVLGAFVFAAQMINFPILPGTSGHLGGGVLLAILLGPDAATLVLTAILIVQCLIFQDGGLLALGANILNMGVLPSYLGYACFRGLVGVRPGPARLYLAVFMATMLGMVGGAALVPLEVWASGLVQVPLLYFLAVMVGLHVLVATGEAMITFLVIGYVSRVRPHALGPVAECLAESSRGLPPRALIGSLFIAALLMGGVVSLFASSRPDALEWLTGGNDASRTAVVKENPNETVARVTAMQQHTAVLPDYRFTSASGLLGACATLVIVWGVGRMLNRRAPREDGS